MMLFKFLANGLKSMHIGNHRYVNNIFNRIPIFLIANKVILTIYMVRIMRSHDTFSAWEDRAQATGP